MLLLLLACADKPADTSPETGAADSAPAEDSAPDSAPADDSGEAGDSGATDGPLTLSATDNGTLHLRWQCEDGQTLEIGRSGAVERTLTAERCPRELEISGPAGEAVTASAVDGAGAALGVVEDTLPALPAGIYEVGDGLELDGEALFDDGALVLAYKFHGEPFGDDWGDGAVVLLDRLGRHLLHAVTAASEGEDQHNSAWLDLAAGELSFTAFTSTFSEAQMAENRVGRLQIGGAEAGQGLRWLAAPQGHHFHFPDGEDLLFIDVQRICSFEGTGLTAAVDRVVRLDPATGAAEVVFDEAAEYLPSLLARYGAGKLLERAEGNYLDHDCGGATQSVRDLTHSNAATCDGERCLVTSLGSEYTLLVVDAASGALLHDLSTFELRHRGDLPGYKGFFKHHDPQWVGEDRVLVYGNGDAETGGYVSLLQVEWPAEPGQPGAVVELWTTRGGAECVGSEAMGWASGLDIEGDPLGAFLTEVGPGDDPAGWPGARLLVSYGTGGLVAVEDTGGARLAGLRFDDDPPSPCDEEVISGKFTGEAHHYSEASLAAAFPDWIRLD
jgi:hypothetical protein